MTKNVSLPTHPLAAIAICIAVSITGCSGDQGPERFGFTGKVTVNGKPAHRMIVQLTHLDPQTGERERYVSSKTNESGEFVFGNRADGTPSGFQGAVAGKYSVTFSWMSTDDLDAVDQFAGKFTDSARSSFQVTVPVPPEASPVVFAIQSHP